MGPPTTLARRRLFFVPPHSFVTLERTSYVLALVEKRLRIYMYVISHFEGNWYTRRKPPTANHVSYTECPGTRFENRFIYYLISKSTICTWSQHFLQNLGTDLDFFKGIVAQTVAGVNNSEKKKDFHPHNFNKKRKSRYIFGNIVADIPYHSLCACY